MGSEKLGKIIKEYPEITPHTSHISPQKKCEVKKGYEKRSKKS